MKTDTKKDVFEESLLTIVAKSVSEMKGVTKMADVPDVIRGGILARDTFVRDGIKIVRDKTDNLVLDVYIRVEYGIKIPQLAWELQRQIQSDVKKDIGIGLSDINIHVEGVDMGDEND